MTSISEKGKKYIKDRYKYESVNLNLDENAKDFIRFDRLPTFLRALNSYRESILPNSKYSRRSKPRSFANYYYCCLGDRIDP